MPKSDKCACGIRVRVHKGKSRRNQLPDVKTDRFGVPRPGPGRRTAKRKAKNDESHQL